MPITRDVLISGISSGDAIELLGISSNSGGKKWFRFEGNVYLLTDDNFEEVVGQDLEFLNMHLDELMEEIREWENS